MSASGSSSRPDWRSNGCRTRTKLNVVLAKANMQNWQTCFCIFPVFARHRRDITQPNMEIFESFLPPFSQPGRVMACMRALDGLLRHIKIRATMSSQRHTHKAIIMVHVNLVPYYQEHTHTQYTVGMEMLCVPRIFWWIYSVLFAFSFFWNA